MLILTLINYFSHVLIIILGVLSITIKITFSILYFTSTVQLVRASGPDLCLAEDHRIEPRPLLDTFICSRLMKTGR